MDREYEALPIRELGPGAGFRRPTQAQANRVRYDSPALDVMTDLTRVSPATIRPHAPLSAADKFMITRGVRLLLVADDLEILVGVITAADILGERSVQASTARAMRRDELTVADVMTPASQVEVLEFTRVQVARVGHVIETLRRAGRQHALVVEYDSVPSSKRHSPPVNRAIVRGIFSLSQVARQLGISVPTGGEVARTFSEIEAVLGR